LIFQGWKFTDLCGKNEAVVLPLNVTLLPLMFYNWSTKLLSLGSTPYLCICFEIYITVGASNICCVKNVSRIKIIKSCLRFSMSENQLLTLSAPTENVNMFESLILKIRESLVLL